MDESPQPYREVRALLADLVASWPWDRPGTPFENAKVYLDFHCAECGTRLSLNDLAVVLELEMLRLGTADARKVPYHDPICVRCYIRRAAPVCRLDPDAADGMVGIDARYLSDARSMDHGALQASARVIHIRAPRNSAGLREEHPAPLGSSPLQDTARCAVSRQPIWPQRTWWRYAGACLLVVAMLLIALALDIALHSFPTQAHTSTLTHPTTPAMTTTAVSMSQPGSHSFRVDGGAYAPLPIRAAP